MTHLWFTVQDSQFRHGIYKALVNVIGPTGSIARGITDGNGTFDAGEIPEGEYFYRVLSEGFYEKASVIRVSGPETHVFVYMDRVPEWWIPLAIGVGATSLLVVGGTILLSKLTGR